MDQFTLQTLLANAALRHPDRSAVLFNGRPVSYAELGSMSTRLAAALAGRGMTTGDRVGIMLPKSPEAIVSLFGALKAGGVYVPIDPAAPIARIRHILVACGVRFLITSAGLWQETASELDDTPLCQVILTGPIPSNPDAGNGQVGILSWNACLEHAESTFTPAGVLDTDPAYILHTSGSTGVPKGVVISHRNALAFVRMAAPFFGFGPNDRVANHAPLHFDLSVFDIFCAVHAGATIVPVPEYLNTFPGRLAEFIHTSAITVWNSVSSVLVMLADRGRLERFRFEALRLVHFSGDVMPVKYLRVLKRHMEQAAFYNIYGQTEANSSLCYPVADLPESDSWKIPLGKALPGFDPFVLGEDSRVATAPGSEGELYIAGRTVALGYWGDRERTLERFVPDPRDSRSRSVVYRTGDLVRIDREGNFVFAGRRDHQIKSRGYRIELDEIETAINSHPDVKQGVALALPDEQAGNRIIAIVAPREGAALAPEDLITFCAARLPKYMLPESVICRASMPSTSTGKIDRSSLARSMTPAPE